MNQTGSGQIMNLLSNDVNRFDQLTMFLNYIWIMPIQVIFYPMKSVSVHSDIIKQHFTLFFLLKSLKLISFTDPGKNKDRNISRI